MTVHPPEILDLALSLGVTDPDPESGIVRRCLERIEGWVRENGGVGSIGELESLVLARLHMVVEEINLDGDFERLAETYAKDRNDPIFACLNSLFEEDVYGALIQRRNVSPEAPDRVVAVIDCRGPKASRRYFTRWHEIAHRLTTHAELPKVLFRSGDSPVERLVDEVASQVGFYRPLLDKALLETGGEPFSIQKVSAVAKRFPGASFKATLLACVKAHPEPVTFVEFETCQKPKGFRRILHNPLVGERDIDFLLDYGMSVNASEGFTETRFESEHGQIMGMRFPGASYGIAIWGSRNA
jgi:hypothetical protein